MNTHFTFTRAKGLAVALLTFALFAASAPFAVAGDDLYAARASTGDRVEAPTLKLKERSGGARVRPSATDLANYDRCPLGTVLTPFDMPIYDEEGPFVVGYETVWYCLPEDLEPAG